MKVIQISGMIVNASVEIHKILGPGLSESVYEECLHHELTSKGLVLKAKKPYR
jgi:GxxExxY protein